MSNNIRRIPLAEKQLVLDFLNEHWGSKHPLVNHEVLFNYYFLDGEMTNFYVSEDNDGVCAICGYIKCSNEENPDIWISIWCAKKGKNGQGLALMGATSQTISSPFSLRVEPVSTMSTIPSERPRRGASSTDPSILTTSTSRPRVLKYSFVTFGYFEATILCP